MRMVILLLKNEQKKAKQIVLTMKSLCINYFRDDRRGRK